MLFGGRAEVRALLDQECGKVLAGWSTRLKEELEQSTRNECCNRKPPPPKKEDGRRKTALGARKQESRFPAGGEQRIIEAIRRVSEGRSKKKKRAGPRDEEREHRRLFREKSENQGNESG